MIRSIRETFDAETKLSWVLGGVAGLLGATAFTHSIGYFVTFMTGNAQRAVLGFFIGDPILAVSAAGLMLMFLAGVLTAAWARRRLWPRRPYGAIAVTTLALVAATLLDWTVCGGPTRPLPYPPIALVTFGVGSLNTTFVKNGEVSIPLSYVTGTLVKLGQGIERHASGGKVTDWLGYFLMMLAFMTGALIGGVASSYTGGTQMLGIASLGCAAALAYSYSYSHRRSIWK